jgi:hypothetical protein
MTEPKVSLNAKWSGNDFNYWCRIYLYYKFDNGFYSSYFNHLL